MKLKHRLGDFISAFVIVIGLMLDLSHSPYGKAIFYGGFLMMALSQVYYELYLVMQRKERVQWYAIVVPIFLILGVVLFFFTDAKSSLALVILALSTAMIQKSKFLTASK